MALGLYIEAVKKHYSKNPDYLEELNQKLGGLMDRCPECSSPILLFATRFRQGYKECICPIHGLVLVEMV